MVRRAEVKQQWTRYLSGGLAVLTLLLSLASVSPALHDWLHVKDTCQNHCESSNHDEPISDQAEPHICAVTLLSMGATTSILPVLPIRSDLIFANLSIDTKTLWCGQAPLRLSTRAPPTETVV